MGGGPRTARTAGILAGALFIASAFVTLATPFLPAHPSLDQAGVVGVGLVALCIGTAVMFIPWQRWSVRAPSILVLVAQLLIALHNHFGGDDPYRYGLFFLVTFAWIGMTQRRWTSLTFLPTFLVAYLAPLLIAHRPGWALSSVLYAAPVCILVAESLAWTGDLLDQAREEVVRREQRLDALVRHSADVVGVIDASGTVRYVSPAAKAAFGFSPDDLVGSSAFDFVVEGDRHVAEDLLAEAVEAPKMDISREFRVLDAAGAERWVEARVTNLLGEPAVEGLVVNLVDISTRREMTDRLRYFAYTDPITSLPNRTAFRDHLDAAVTRAKRTGSTTAVLFIDLDDFKGVNDSLGHEAGDTVLGLVAVQLQAAVAPGHLLARLGGDEFTVVMEDVAGEAEVEMFAQRLLAAVVAPVEVMGLRVVVGCSIGAAIGEAGALPVGELLRRADLAMYLAKGQGSNHYAAYGAASVPGT